MQKVYSKCTFGGIDMVGGLRKLNDFIGDFTIEGHDYASGHNDILIISFYTDKVSFEEGESRNVEIFFKNTPEGITELDRIQKM